MKKFVLNSLAMFLTVCSWSQIGGQGVYDFLNVPVTARQAALGGDFISVKDQDIASAFRNPAILNQSMSGFLMLSYINYIGDINFGQIGYVKSGKNETMWSFGLKYANYGKFIETTNGGEQIGRFNAADYAFVAGMSKPIINDFWQIGVNFKPVFSSYYNYYSIGAVADFGVVYSNDSTGWSAGTTFSNLGMQIKPYVKGNREPVIPNLTIGVSKKIAHTPLRVSLTAQNLQKFNLIAFDTTQTITKINDFGQEEQVKQKLPFTTKIITHFIVGTEFIPSNNFAIRFGYNFLRRYEMRFANKTGLVGVSFGVAFKVSKFKFSYSLANYHLAGNTHYFTITTRVSEFIKQKSNYQHNHKNDAEN